MTNSSTVGCPASAQTLFQSVGGTLTVLVQIQGSDPYNGFNIQIQTDNTVLAAAGASVGIFGSGATVVLECLDGTLVHGNNCDTTDGPGVLHFAAVAAPGTTVSANGVLFTATYNVVSATAGIPLNLMSVTISNGSTVNSETTLGAMFSNLNDFTITASPAAISVPPGANGTSTLTLTAFGTFADTVQLTVTPSAGLNAFVDNAFPFISGGAPATVTLTVNGATSGSYSVLVDAMSLTNVPTIDHPITVPVTITPSDFSLAVSPASLGLAPGSSGTSTATVTSISGFTGTVSLSTSVSPAGPTATASPSSVVLGSSGTSTITVSVPSGTTPGTYMVTVTGVSGSRTHSAMITVHVGVPDFSMNAVPDTVVVFRQAPSGTAATTLNFGSINNFAATLSLTATINFAFVSTPGSASLPFTLPASVMLTSGGTASADIIASIVRATAGTGEYVATITAVGGGKTHTVTFAIWVIDFTVTPQDTTIKMINVPGTIAQDPVQILPIGAPYNATGFNINPGLTEGVLQIPTDHGYNPDFHHATSNNGIRFASTLGMDQSFTARRCFAAIYDSSGNLIEPVYNAAGSTVESFAAPVVHLNGDQFGFPPAFNGCRFDSFWYVDPQNGNAIATPYDIAQITVEPLNTTPNGTYTALVCLVAGGDVNCVNITIILVAPPAPPALNQFNGRTATVSLAAGGQGNFKVGITNQDGTNTIYIQATITAVSSDGSITITGSTGVVAIPINSKVNNIPVSLNFAGVPAGTTFNENIVIAYGVAPHYLTLTSSATIGTPLKLTGSVVVTP